MVCRLDAIMADRQAGFYTWTITVPFVLMGIFQHVVRVTEVDAIR